LTTLDQRRALALRIAKTIQRDPASIVASLRARLDTTATTAFDFNRRQPRDYHGRWTDKPGGSGGGLGKFIKKAVGKFSPSEQEEYDKLETKLRTTGHLRGKDAERHSALRKKLHGSPSPSEDDGPTRADNETRHRELLSKLKSDEGLSGSEMKELQGLDVLSLYDMSKADWKKLGTDDKARIYEALGDPTHGDDDEIEDLWRKVTDFEASDSGSKPSPKQSDVDEFMRLENKLDNSYLTDAENARHDELRRKIEGPQRARERELDDIAENRGYVTDEEVNYLNQLTDSEFANEADEFFLHGMTRDAWKSLSEAKKAVVYKNLETIDDEDLWRKFTDFEGS
jgi:hypothetical protein